MQFIFSKNGVLTIEIGKGTYNREGYIYLSQDFFRLKGTYKKRTFWILKKGTYNRRVFLIENRE